MVNDYITKQKYYSLKISDALLPKTYGLLKTHKKDSS